MLPPIVARSMGVMPCMLRGVMVPVTPSMRSMFMMFEPITFPMAMPLRPFWAATTLVASSGSDVPPATMVRPTTASLTPSVCATQAAPSTRSTRPWRRWDCISTPPAPWRKAWSSARPWRPVPPFRWGPLSPSSLPVRRPARMKLWWKTDRARQNNHRKSQNPLGKQRVLW